MEDILSHIQTIAIVGLSNRPQRYSYKVATYLKDQGYTIIPINPNLDTILNTSSYPSVNDVPKNIHIDAVVLFRKSEYALMHTQEVIARGGIQVIWMQEGIEDINAKNLAKSHGLHVVMNTCIMKVHQQLFHTPTSTIPVVTVEQMKEVDRLMIEEIGVSIRMMMENASRSIAACTRELLRSEVKDKHVVVLCGKGNNGGDGLGAARHLINYGAHVNIVLTCFPEELVADAKAQYDVLTRTHANVYEFHLGNEQSLINLFKKADIIIDSLLGYNLKGNPREPIATTIQLANESKKPILAVDVPTGLDADTGKPKNPTIVSQNTITLALPKKGLIQPHAKKYVGNMFVADLSVPKEVYKRLGIDVPILFEKNTVIPYTV